MFGSCFRVVRTALCFLVGSVGLLVFVAALLVVTAVPAESASGFGCSAPRSVGLFSPCARLDLSGVDDFRPASLSGDARQGA
jgi:hypothetical protein